MAEFRCITKGGADPQGKPRVYFTCHPDDFELYFDKICSDIFDVKEINCAIYYTPDMSEPLDETNLTVDLARINLFIVPVSLRLMSEPCRAMSVDIAFAKEKNIHILPFMMETDISGSGIVELYSLKRNFGDRQYLNPNSCDTSEIAYTDKLRKHLESVLVSDKLARRVRAAFDAYIFLSYRKKDRLYANELMRVIHGIPGCRDIAIWYDEFLTPGENWRDNIRSAMRMVKEKSNLFTLLVTPNLLEEYLDKDGKIKKNFVMETEYPEAKDMGMNILPTEAQDTDFDKLKNKYEDIPKPLRLDDEHFSEEFLSVVDKIAKSENDDDPEHNFLIGLAYLEGIDVEVDVERGVSLITSAAEAGLVEAMRKLYRMYSRGDRVEVDYDEAVIWACRTATYYMREEGEESPNTIWAIHDVGNALTDAGDYDEAIRTFASLYELRQRKLGAGHPDTLVTLTNLALAYIKNGDPISALDIQKQLYDVQLENLGEDDPDTICTLNNLALAYGDAGDNAQALILFERASEISKRVHGSDSLETLKTLNNLAVIHMRLGHYDTAYEMQSEICDLSAKALGDRHPETLLFLGNLALTLEKMGEKDRALEIGERVHQISLEVLGEKHPETLTAINNLGMYYSEFGEYDRSLELYERAFEISKEIYGEDNPKTAKIANNISTIYVEIGRGEEGISLLESACDTQCSILGEKHPNSISYLENLATYLWEFGDKEKAISLFEKLYSLRCELMQEKSNEALRYLDYISFACGELGEMEKRLDADRRKYEISMEMYGEENLETLRHLNNYAADIRDIDRDRAIMLMERAYLLRSKLLGEEAPETVTSLCNLITMYSDAGRHDKSLLLSKKLYQIRIKTHGKDAPEALLALHCMAADYAYCNKHEKGLDFMIKAYVARCRVLSEDDPETVKSLEFIKSISKAVAQAKGCAVLEKTYVTLVGHLGKHHACMLVLLPEFATACFDAGNRKSAITFHERLYDLYLNLFGHFDERTVEQGRLLNFLRSK